MAFHQVDTTHYTPKDVLMFATVEIDQKELLGLQIAVMVFLIMKSANAVLQIVLSIAFSWLTDHPY